MVRRTGLLKKSSEVFRTQHEVDLNAMAQYVELSGKSVLAFKLLVLFRSLNGEHGPVKLLTHIVDGRKLPCTIDKCTDAMKTRVVGQARQTPADCGLQFVLPPDELERADKVF